MRSGRSVVFKGLTDGAGKFATTPLQPGVYTFEVRVPKTIVTPARYFLSLSGAKPVSDPMMGRGVALMMDAQVRSLREVRGQVTGRRIRFVPAATAATTVTTPPAPASRAAAPGTRAPTPTVRAATASSSRAATAPTSRAATVPAAPNSSAFVPRPVGPRSRMIAGRRYEWVQIAPGSNLGRWLPARGEPAPAAAPAPAARPTATPQPSPRPRSSPARR